MGDTQEALEILDEAVRLASSSGDESVEWLARISRSELQATLDPHSLSTEDARVELETAIERFGELEDEAGLATAWTLLAFLGFMPCRYDQADLAAGRAVEHARRSGEEVLLARALRMRLFSQDLGSATPEAGYRTLDEMGDDIARSRPLEASALAFRGSFAAREGSFDEARRLTGLAIEISEALGTKGFVAVHEQWLGGVELLAGDPVAAERAFRRSYEIHDEIDNEGNKSTASAFLALALCALGRFDEAELFAATARSVAAEDDLASQVVGRSAMALVLASRDAFDEAERLAREAVQMYEEAECPEGQGDATMTLAEVLRAADKIGDAERAARVALAFYQRKGNTPAAQAARTFLDSLPTSSARTQPPDEGNGPSPRGEGPVRVAHITSKVSNTISCAPPSRTGQVSANFAAWSSESASITE